MPRLPEPGKDAGKWGDILNEYLSTSIDDDGSLNANTVGSAQLKPNAVTSVAVADGAIEETKLSSAVAAKLNAAGAVTSVATKTGAVVLDKGDVGLDNIDNVSDINKPISSAVQTALNLKVNSSSVGAASGIATLGSDMKIPESQLPARLGASELTNTLSDVTSVLKPLVNYAPAGDSNTAYNGGTNWTSLLSMASYGRVRRVGVFAAGGYTLQQWRDLLMPNLLALTGRDKVQLVSLMLGTNNVGDELGKLRSDYEAVLDTLAAAGVLVAPCTVPPRMDSAASKAWAQQWNAIVVQIAYERDLPLLDVYSTLVDPATGDFKTGYYPNGETIHFFTVAGQMAVARGLRTPFLNIISKVNPRFAKANTSADNLASNALMMTSGGKFNGVNGTTGYAAGWQSNSGLTIASGAPSLYTDAAGFTWQRLKDIDTTLLLNQMWVNIAPGHRYEVLMKLRPLGFTAADASTYTVDMSYVNGATVKPGLVGYQPPIVNESPISSTDENDYLVVRFEGVAPSDATQIRVTVTLTKNAGTLVGKTLDYTALTVYDLTKAERMLVDAVTTAGSANLTSAKAVFTSADIGKTINVYGAGAGGTILTTTIISVTSATVAVMATSATVAVPVAKLLIAPIV